MLQVPTMSLSAIGLLSKQTVLLCCIHFGLQVEVVLMGFFGTYYKNNSSCWQFHILRNSSYLSSLCRSSFFWHLNITGGTFWLEIVLTVLHELCILFGSRATHNDKCLALAGKTKKNKLHQQKNSGQYNFELQEFSLFLSPWRDLWIPYFD